MAKTNAIRFLKERIKFAKLYRSDSTQTPDSIKEPSDNKISSDLMRRIRERFKEMRQGITVIIEESYKETNNLVTALRSVIKSNNNDVALSQ